MTLEITIREAEIILLALGSSLPSKENEVISFMLFHRIRNKIDQQSKQT